MFKFINRYNKYMIKNFGNQKLKAVLTATIFLLSAFHYPGIKKINIVFIGDSITYGGNNPALEPSGYAVTYLKNKLGIDSINQANEGVSGKTTVDFLPSETCNKNVLEAADGFFADKGALLLFSIMLGTNDSAMQGTNGAPVAPDDYRHNLEIIINQLLNRYPGCKVVINYPLWYSPNTYNGAKYLAEGLARLQSYSPQIKLLVKNYAVSNPGRVYNGDEAGFNYFKNNYIPAMKHEEGRQGIFYLHPNEQGAAQLGLLWGKAIYGALKK